MKRVKTIFLRRDEVLGLHPESITDEDDTSFPGTSPPPGEGWSIANFSSGVGSALKKGWNWSKQAYVDYGPAIKEAATTVSAIGAGIGTTIAFTNWLANTINQKPGASDVTLTVPPSILNAWMSFVQQSRDDHDPKAMESRYYSHGPSLSPVGFFS